MFSVYSPLEKEIMLVNNNHTRGKLPVGKEQDGHQGGINVTASVDLE